VIICDNPKGVISKTYRFPKDLENTDLEPVAKTLGVPMDDLIKREL
jgi:hypothetical protein